MRKFKKALIFLSWLWLAALGNSKLAFAQHFTGPTSSALGGAGRAAGGSEAHLLNPASLVHLKDYRFDGIYRYNSMEGRGSVRDWGVNVSDGNDEALFRGGFTYVNTELKVPGTKFKRENFILSFGGWVQEGLSLGIQAQRWTQRNAIGGSEDEIWQGTFGGLYVPTENLGLAIVIHNFLDDHNAEIRPEIGLGSHLIVAELFRFRLDTIYPTKYNPRKKGIVSLGFEAAHDNGLRMRTGLKVDDAVARTNYWTAGLGWEGPKFSLDWAYEKNVRTKGETRQTFDLSIPF